MQVYTTQFKKHNNGPYFSALVTPSPMTPHHFCLRVTTILNCGLNGLLFRLIFLNHILHLSKQPLVEFSCLGLYPYSIYCNWLILLNTFESKPCYVDIFESFISRSCIIFLCQNLGQFIYFTAGG